MRKFTLPSITTALVTGALVAGLVAAPTSSWASNTRAKLNRVQVDSQGQRILINMTKVPAGAPDCHDRTKRMSLPMSNPAAKMLLATLLTAISGKKDVRIVGTGFCDIDRIETIEQVHIYP